MHITFPEYLNPFHQPVSQVLCHPLTSVRSCLASWVHMLDPSNNNLTAVSQATCVAWLHTCCERSIEGSSGRGNMNDKWKKQKVKIHICKCTGTIVLCSRSGSSWMRWCHLCELACYFVFSQQKIAREVMMISGRNWAARFLRGFTESQGIIRALACTRASYWKQETTRERFVTNLKNVGRFWNVNNEVECEDQLTTELLYTYMTSQGRSHSASAKRPWLVGGPLN